MKNENVLPRKINTTLNAKISFTHNFSKDVCLDITDNPEIVSKAYKKASELFNSESAESIAVL